ncbi:MAG: hypothetical protein OQK58_07545 [Gammaproteobacteria bacterium]|nr:hypothetical protein [Gammaproteobacteria bacterium]
MSESSSLKRRQFLSGLMKLLVFIGLVFVSIPFISSFSSNDISDKQAEPSHWIIKYPLAELVYGQVTVLNWSAGNVWVYARTAKDIKALQNKNAVLLRDALSKYSDQPENLQNNVRSMNENFFVFIPNENKRNCQVSLTDSEENVVFSEPCFNAKYDAAGRIFKNTGHKDQQNLAVPEHVIEDGILKVGVWIPKRSRY